MGDEGFMALALEEARLAAGKGEVPVGAIVVRHGQVISSGRNAPIDEHDPTAHAEIIALRAAALSLGNYRLDECEIFVTLEPCAMCAGAMLHARVKRVVFGAADAKTGAAGSVLNLFALPQLNHQTTAQGGVLAEPCLALLQNFFRLRRAGRKATQGLRHPLREDALRTPDSAFEGLQAYTWPAHYVSDLPALAGLRLHYLDERGHVEDGGTKPLTFLCLHSSPAWSYLYCKMITPLVLAGHRVVVPDMVGFGKSDKPKKERYHTLDVHRQILVELVERLDLQNIVLVVQGSGGLLGLTLPMDAPHRYHGVLVMNTPPACTDAPIVAARFLTIAAPEYAAYSAPFPDKGYRAALRAFPQLVSGHESEDGETILRRARQFWCGQWTGQTLMVMVNSEKGPILGLPATQELCDLLRGCGDPRVLQQAGLVVPEDGEQLATMALGFFGRVA